MGSALLVQDLSAELEQSLMARSGFFVGTLRSSVPVRYNPFSSFIHSLIGLEADELARVLSNLQGWVLNQRASQGFSREESLLYKISY